MSLLLLLRRRTPATPAEPTFTTAYSRRALMQFMFPLSPILVEPDGSIANAADRAVISGRTYGREAA